MQDGLDEVPNLLQAPGSAVVPRGELALQAGDPPRGVARTAVPSDGGRLARMSGTGRNCGCHRDVPGVFPVGNLLSLALLHRQVLL